MNRVLRRPKSPVKSKPSVTPDFKEPQKESETDKGTVKKLKTKIVQSITTVGEGIIVKEGVIFKKKLTPEISVTD
jgi:hypothetical protein